MQELLHMLAETSVYTGNTPHIDFFCHMAFYTHSRLSLLFFCWLHDMVPVLTFLGKEPYYASPGSWCNVCTCCLALTFWYKLSYTLTVPGLVAIVLRQTQCEPVFMICTNSLMAGVTNAPTIAGSRRPSTRGNFCFRKTCWQGNWIGWLFFLLSLNQSGKLAYSFFWLWGPVSSGDFFGFSMMFFFGWVTSMKIPFFWWHKGTGNFIYTRYV